MSGFKIPLDFSSGNFFENNWLTSIKQFESANESIKEAIKNFIQLLINSHEGSFIPDPQFGFSLKNCYFQTPNSKDELQGKKMGGKSNSANNFAKDLEKAINQYETRLKHVEIQTDYFKEQSKMTVSITGIIAETRKEFKQDVTLYIWKKNENVR